MNVTIFYQKIVNFYSFENWSILHMIDGLSPSVFRHGSGTKYRSVTECRLAS